MLTVKSHHITTVKVHNLLTTKPLSGEAVVITVGKTLSVTTGTKGKRPFCCKAVSKTLPAVRRSRVEACSLRRVTKTFHTVLVAYCPVVRQS